MNATGTDRDRQGQSFRGGPIGTDGTDWDGSSYVLPIERGFTRVGGHMAGLSQSVPAVPTNRRFAGPCLVNDLSAAGG